jgi:mRNA interferase HigB
MMEDGVYGVRNMQTLRLMPYSQYANIAFVHVITQRRLSDFWKKHPTARSPLISWYKATRNAKWTNFEELRTTFNSADMVGSYVVFDIGGNNFRLIAKVEYRWQKVFIAYIFTHAGYDRWNNGR